MSERIHTITLAEAGNARRSMEAEHERAVAIADLKGDNSFAPAGLADGPYDVHLSVAENRLSFDIRSQNGSTHHVLLPVQSLRGIIRDYFLICESYYAALKGGGASKIEAVDMGRRGMHNEGAQALQALLEGKIAVDFQTARRLFTLVCVLHIR